MISDYLYSAEANEKLERSTTKTLRLLPRLNASDGALWACL